MGVTVATLFLRSPYAWRREEGGERIGFKSTVPTASASSSKARRRPKTAERTK